MNVHHFYLTVFLVFILISCGSSPTAWPANPTPTPTAQFDASAEDLEAIQQTALDYIEGWYEGNAERVERSLHPQLAKRVIQDNMIYMLSVEQMLEYTRQGGGTGYTGQKIITVTILDVYNEIATVKTVSPEYIDFLHVGKVNGRWVIINVLWTGRRPE